MIDDECTYFPCHDGMSDCKHCFCPLYHMEDCGGDWVLTINGVKDCSSCIRVHTEEGRRYVLNRLEGYEEITQ